VRAVQAACALIGWHGRRGMESTLKKFKEELMLLGFLSMVGDPAAL
jgi:hypothetical protein